MEKMKQSVALALDAAVNEGKMGQTWADAVLMEFDKLVADAQRLNGVRMVICEQDKALRERMGEAMASAFEVWADTLTHETIVTPEAFNAMVDSVLLAACEARK